VKYIIGVLFALLILLIPSLSVPSSQEQVAQNLVPESNVVLQKVVIDMNIPDNPTLPFGCVWGTVQNAAPGYPVEIEIFKDGKPVYFAQTNVQPDGSYQQYFRVISVENGNVLHIFKGDYNVQIFKYVVKNPDTATTT
jgi:hypothetical protein